MTQPLGERVKQAVRALRGQVAGEVVPYGPPYLKAVPPLWTERQAANWRMGQGSSKLADYIAEGFEGNSVIYGALMYKARSVISAPLRAYEGSYDHPEPLPEDHPLAQLLARPNPYQSQGEFRQLLTVYLNLAGTAYVVLDRPTKSAPPTAMYCLRPDRVVAIPDDARRNELLGYAYRPEGGADALPIVLSDMMRFKLPNPRDSLMGLGEGLSPLTALAKSADVDNDVTAYLKEFFQHGAMLQHAIKLNVPITDDTADRIKARWKAMYGGVENWDEVGVFDETSEIQRLSPTFDEMGFAAIDSRNETRMLMPFGVPGMLIGARYAMERSTFSNYEEGRRAFWEDTMIPELMLQEATFQYFLNDGPAFVKHDLSQVPALRRDAAALAAAAFNLWRMGVPAAIAADTVGLSLAPFPGDTLSFVSVSGGGVVAPLGTVEGAAEAAEDVAGGASATDDERSTDAGTGPTEVMSYDARAMQRTIDALAVNWERRFEAEAGRQLENDRRELEAILRAGFRDALMRKGTLDWTRLAASIDEYLKSLSIENWREAFIPLLEGVMLDAGREWSAALGIQFAVRNLRAEAWFQAYALQFAQPVSETTAEGVHALLAAAQAEGWGIDATTRRMGVLFEQWIEGGGNPEDFDWLLERLPAYRREMIARTETIRAAGAGSYELGKEWGVQKKEWLSADDARTRDSHREANGQQVMMDEPFIVGGYPMRYPGDAGLGAPAAEFVNCRCTVLLIKE